MIRRVASLGLCLILLTGVCLAAETEEHRLDVQGTGSLSLRLGSVSGSGGEEAYSRQYWDTSTFDHQAQVNVSGFIMDRVFVQGNISSGRFARTSTDLIIRLDTSTKGSDITIGSIRPDVGSNPFVSFSRRLNGVAGKGDVYDGRLAYSFFASRTKGARRTETLPGNDTPGPYLLRYTPILDGSEVVKVDEQPKQRGVDYTIDYYSGVLNFEAGFDGQSNTTIIPSTSTISVSYEQARGGSQEGMLYGLSAKAKVTPRLFLDASYLARVPQYQPSAQAASIKRTEEFFGAGSPGPFWLSYRPIDATQPMTVYLDGNLMQEGLDYSFDQGQMAIEFFVNVSPASIVRVEYYQAQEATTPSQALRVLGLSSSMSLNETTNLRVDFANSLQGGVLSGSAFGLHSDSQLENGKVNLSGNFRSVSPSFSRVDGTGFDQQSTGYDLTCDVKASDFVSVSALMSRERSNSGLSFGYGGGYGHSSGTSGLVSGTTSYAVGTGRQMLDVSLNFPNLPHMSLQRSVMSNSSATGDSAMISNSLGLSYGHGEFSGSARLSMGSQSLSSSYDSGGAAGSTYSAAFGTSSRNLTLSWVPSSRFNLSTNLSSTSSHGGSGGNSGNSLDFSLTHYISDALTLTARRSVSTSSGNTYSSLDTTGTYAGDSGSYGYSTLARLRALEGRAAGGLATYRNLVSAYGLSYAPGPGFSASLFLNQRDYLDTGSAYSTARSSRDSTLSLNKGLGKFLRATANLTNQSNSYGGDYGGDTSGKSLGLNLSYHPRTGGDFSLGYRSDAYRSAGLAGAQSTTATKNSSLIGEYRCSLPHGNSLSSRLNFTSGKGGYADYRRLDWTTEYDIPLNDLFSASIQLIHRKNNALGSGPVGSGSDYSAFSLTAQLAARFQ